MKEKNSFLKVLRDEEDIFKILTPWGVLQPIFCTHIRIFFICHTGSLFIMFTRLTTIMTTTEKKGWNTKLHSIWIFIEFETAENCELHRKESDLTKNGRVFAKFHISDITMTTVYLKFVRFADFFGNPNIFCLRRVSSLQMQIL